MSSSIQQAMWIALASCNQHPFKIRLGCSIIRVNQVLGAIKVSFTRLRFLTPGQIFNYIQSKLAGCRVICIRLLFGNESTGLGAVESETARPIANGKVKKNENNDASFFISKWKTICDYLTGASAAAGSNFIPLRVVGWRPIPKWKCSIRVFFPPPPLLLLLLIILLLLLARRVCSVTTKPVWLLFSVLC